MDLDLAITSFQEEHKDLYERLDYFMSEFTKVKKIPNNPHLISTSQDFLLYLKDLLEGHFLEEEKVFDSLFTEKSLTKEQSERILNDHREITDKYQVLKSELNKITEQNLGDEELASMDLTRSLLFPSYNLIATINHHAAREDEWLFA